MEPTERTANDADDTGRASQDKTIAEDTSPIPPSTQIEPLTSGKLTEAERLFGGQSIPSPSGSWNEAGDEAPKAPESACPPSQEGKYSGVGSAEREEDCTEEEASQGNDVDPPPEEEFAPPTINELARKLYHAKRAESNAKDVRIGAEEAIIALIPVDSEAGSKTVDAGNGMRVTIKRGLTFKADVDAIRNLDLDGVDLPLTHTPSTYTFDKKAYAALKACRPAVFAKLAEHVTVTPAKTAVTIKLV